MSDRGRIEEYLSQVGEVVLFGCRAIRAAFRPPYEFRETITQICEVGWRSCVLIIASGFAVGFVLAMQTRASMESFGAQALIPEAVTYGLFRDIGPVVAGLLVAGRVGAGIGAELAGMRVAEQIDALEAIAINSFKYLVVTRIVACVIAMPVLTTILDFSGLAGGMTSDLVSMHMSVRMFLTDAFSTLTWADFIPPIAKTLVFGFLIGTVSCYLGYNATHGTAGVGRASTRSVVFSSVLIILADVILVKMIQFWFPG